MCRCRCLGEGDGGVCGPVSESAFEAPGCKVSVEGVRVIQVGRSLGVSPATTLNDPFLIEAAPG